MVVKPDAGAIIAQEATPILEHENARQVFEKLVPLARTLLTKTVPLFRDGREKRTPQNPAEASYFGARTPADGRIDWSWPSERIHNLVRGVTRPYPGAFAFVEERKLFVWKGEVWNDGVENLTHTPPPGTVLGPVGQGVGVATGNGYYVVLEAQFDGSPEGKPEDFLFEGMQLGDVVTKEF
jgi:methionyl-tRNA formyltransferase